MRYYSLTLFPCLIGWLLFVHSSSLAATGQSRQMVSKLSLSSTLYQELWIFKDTSGTKAFQQVIAEEQLFQPNTTRIDFEPNHVYWVKLLLEGESQDTLQPYFHITDNAWGEHSWNYIDAWLVRDSGVIEKQKTGIAIPKRERSVPSTKNLVGFRLAPKEQATLYVRLSGVHMPRTPRTIQINVVYPNKNPGMFEGYPFKGRFEGENPYSPFRANGIYNHELWIDTLGTTTFETVQSQQEFLSWKDMYQVKHQTNTVYWLRTRFIGSPYFNGQQILHLSFGPGTDQSSFDRVDGYAINQDGVLQQQQTGDHVPLKNRPFYFWANFIKLNISPTDTIDLFLRMEGADARHLMPYIGLWHIDKDSLFPRQVIEGEKDGFFYGILGVMFFYFMLLYVVEKEQAHLYFIILALGLFLGHGFTEGNFGTFVPFPRLRDYHVPLYYLGVFMGEFGLIKFTQAYFGFPKQSIISKWVVPVFIALISLVSLNAVLQFRDNEMSVFHFQYLDSPSTWQSLSFWFVPIMVVGCIGLSFMMAIIAPKQKYVSKPFFFLTFLPLFLVAVVFFGMSFFLSWLGIADQGNVKILLDIGDLFKITIVFMLTMLALTTGYRTNRLKAERSRALEQNLADQQTIIEKLKQTDHLQALDRLKSTFYTNITHEFRTPLTIILGLTEDDVLTPKSAQLIRRNGKKLLGLINQLLDLSKLETGLLKPQLQQMEMVALTRYIGESFQSLAEQKHLQLTIYSELKSLWMDTDEEKYRQIISNLLSNAIKFTPENGRIILHLNSEGQFLTVQVRDNGMGIPPEELHFIFDRFYQVEHPQSATGQGTGIGLALVKELVELLNGEIFVMSSTQPNEKGTTFELRFPIHQLTLKANVKDEPTLPIDSLPKTVFYSLPKTSDHVKERYQLLIIEDNPDIVVYLEQLLHHFYDVLVAPNGEKGIEMALETVPDIIISDVMMPKKTGFEVLQSLKTDPRTSHIPIILLTAKATKEDKLKGLKHGADAYLMKPFDKSELFIRLKNLIEVRQLIQEKNRHFNPNVVNETNPEDQFLTKLHAIIAQNLANAEFKIDDYAHAMNRSHTQFYRKIKGLTGQTPTQYLRKIRLDKAKKLLMDSSLQVSEVAYSVGFNDPNYFARVFSKEVGVSPNAYRK